MDNNTINSLLAVIGGFVLSFQLNYLVWRWQTRKVKK